MPPSRLDPDTFLAQHRAACSSLDAVNTVGLRYWLSLSDAYARTLPVASQPRLQHEQWALSKVLETIGRLSVGSVAGNGWSDVPSSRFEEMNRPLRRCVSPRATSFPTTSSTCSLTSPPQPQQIPPPSLTSPAVDSAMAASAPPPQWALEREAVLRSQLLEEGFRRCAPAHRPLVQKALKSLDADFKQGKLQSFAQVTVDHVLSMAGVGPAAPATGGGMVSPGFQPAHPSMMMFPQAPSPPSQQSYLAAPSASYGPPGFAPPQGAWTGGGSHQANPPGFFPPGYAPPGFYAPSPAPQHPPPHHHHGMGGMLPAGYAPAGYPATHHYAAPSMAAREVPPPSSYLPYSRPQQPIPPPSFTPPQPQRRPAAQPPPMGATDDASSRKRARTTPSAAGASSVFEDTATPPSARERHRPAMPLPTAVGGRYGAPPEPCAFAEDVRPAPLSSPITVAAVVSRPVGTSTALERGYTRYEPQASELRPPEVLRKALSHILQKSRLREVGSQTAADVKDAKMWLSNQLKGMRQDLKVQGLNDAFAVSVYELHGRLCLDLGDVSEYTQCQVALGHFYDSGLGSSSSSCQSAVDVKCDALLPSTPSPSAPLSLSPSDSTTAATLPSGEQTIAVPSCVSARIPPTLLVSSPIAEFFIYKVLYMAFSGQRDAVAFALRQAAAAGPFVSSAATADGKGDAMPRPSLHAHPDLLRIPAVGCAVQVAASILDADSVACFASLKRLHFLCHCCSPLVTSPYRLRPLVAIFLQRLRIGWLHTLLQSFKGTLPAAALASWLGFLPFPVTEAERKSFEAVAPAPAAAGTNRHEAACGDAIDGMTTSTRAPSSSATPFEPPTIGMGGTIPTDGEGRKGASSGAKGRKKVKAVVLHEEVSEGSSEAASRKGKGKGGPALVPTATTLDAAAPDATRLRPLDPAGGSLTVGPHHSGSDGTWWFADGSEDQSRHEWREMWKALKVDSNVVAALPDDLYRAAETDSPLVDVAPLMQATTAFCSFLNSGGLGLQVTPPI